MAHVLEKKQNSLTDSVEFKDAVQFAVQEALAKSLAEMKAAQAQSEASLLAKAFAMEMARMVGPLNGQIYVDPEVLESREIYDEWKKSISMEMDPVGIEETWITENGITMYGRNPETIDNRIKPKAHPGLTEDDDDDGIDSAVFRKKLDDFSSLDSFQGIVDTNRNKMNIESSLY